MERNPQTFNRTIGLNKAILLMMGNMIGAGIFIYPALISSNLPHPIWFLIIWLLGGAIALTGALSSAELGAVFPEVGGDYAYLRNAYGIRWAFVYGFFTFFITFPGSIALGVSLTVHFQGATLFGKWIHDTALSIPLGFLGTLDIDYAQCIAAIILLGMTCINHFGIHSSLRLQKIVTLVPLFFLVIIYSIAIAIIGWKFFFEPEAGSKVLLANFSMDFSNPSITQLGMALIPVYWTFTGWNSPLALGEDIENPEKVIPLAMTMGPFLVTLLYLLFAFVFVAVIPYSALQSKQIDPFYLMGIYLLNQLPGGFSQFLNFTPWVISLLIFLLVLGNTNSAIISGSRVSVALARDRLFWERIGHLDKKKNTPQLSIWFQSILALLMILTVNKESKLLEFSFIAITFLSILTIGSLFVIRLKKSQKELLYKAFGYPFTPLFYISSSGIILLVLISNYILEKKYSIPIISALFLLAGLLLFEVWKKWRKRKQ